MKKLALENISPATIQQLTSAEVIDGFKVVIRAKDDHSRNNLQQSLTVTTFFHMQAELFKSMSQQERLIFKAVYDFFFYKLHIDDAQFMSAYFDRIITSGRFLFEVIRPSKEYTD
jgi:hypothetical protein